MRPALARLALCVALSGSFAAYADQPLSPAQQFARTHLIVDTHIDAPGELLDRWRDLGVDQPEVEFDYPRARQGGLDVGFMSIYTSAEDDAAGTARQKAHMQIDAIEALAWRHPDRFAIVRSPADVDRLKPGQQVLLAFGMENAAPIGNDLGQLKVFHDRGVRYITLAHSHSNRLADGSYSLKRPHGGLSALGEQAVAEMNRLGIMVDVSHLSDDAVRDVLRVSKAPVIASHSGLRKFTPGFERNLSDELAQAIAKQGGVVQLVFGSGFIDAGMAAQTTEYFRALDAFERETEATRARGETPPKTLEQFDAEWDEKRKPVATKIDQVLDQVDHAVKLLGADHVGIGSDFDGVGGKLPQGLRTVADYPNLVAGMRERGHSDEVIAKVLGENLLRVWREVEKRAQR
ncbi:dipeptidase [Cognatilysobacter bugurensis]|uniref:Dipeptidase n=1 Tax=Cognatilysobacter bugurensis TaxID=543356 RepID=A0A918STF7_9GAMM|nr:dipeptidase [Lysobacter bugurensis]GHA68358.1 dipeptidase [Lysobacter bugurensis]